jgi:uncharacterized protein
MSTDPPDDEQTRQVIDYLRNHPDFFVHHEDLLAELRIPHARGEAVSLVERQVQLLRERLGECNQQLLDLVEVARDNELLGDRIHRMTLALVGADTFDELISVLQDELFDQFQADAVELRLFSIGELEVPDSPDSAVLTQVARFLREGQPTCGRLERPQLEFIFGPLANSIQSTAILPLHEEHCAGILAIGSRSAERFSADKGLLFLKRLGELLNQCLRRVSLPGL